MQDKAKSQKQTTNTKVSLLDQVAILLTIISTITQLIGLGFQIFDYFKPPSQSVEVVQKETKTHSDHIEPWTVDK